MSDNQLHGLLIIDKPGLSAAENTPGSDSGLERQFTSHRIVQLVRRWSGQRRIGHTGTLDPMASGVLVLCLGSATRLVEYYQGHAKQYHAAIVLGVATDTYDALGRVTRQGDVPALERSQIAATLARFEGEILQTPPIYSAIKQGGESLHRRARRGEEVIVESRHVTFHRLELLDFVAPDQVWLRAVCSAGAYMRSLAYDLGLALNTCAHLSALRREKAGAFDLDQAYSLPEIEEAAQHGRLAELLLPSGVGLPLPIVHLDTLAAQRLGYGQTVSLPSTSIRERGEPGSLEEPGSLAQGIDAHGQLMGILRCLGPTATQDFLWRAEKWMSNP